jgi:MoaA/NifB/PqqE/SkfB family radical SAM enzyme
MANKICSNYIPEIASLKTGRKRPAAVSLNLNDQCNQHCVYCEIGNAVQSVSTSKIDFDDIEWIIEQMAAAKIHRLALNGGEPFLYKDIIKVIEMAGEKGIRCSVSSNGMNIFQLGERALKALKRYKTRFNISIDSFDAGINDMTRGMKGALDKALKSADMLLNRQIELSLLCVISKYNYHLLHSYTRTAHQKGIREVLFQPVIFHSNFPDREVIPGKLNLNVGPDKIGELNKELKKILAFEYKHRIKTNTYRIIIWIEEYLNGVSMKNGDYFFSGILNHFYCRELDSIIEINYDGGLLPCGLGKAKYFIKDVKEAGLISGWNMARKELKASMEKQEFHTMCNACCHHFSRNMIASIIKHPYENRRALSLLLPALASRLNHTLYKTILAK